MNEQFTPTTTKNSFQAQLTKIVPIASPHDVVHRLPAKKQYLGPRWWIQLIRALNRTKD